MVPLVLWRHLIHSRELLQEPQLRWERQQLWGGPCGRCLRCCWSSCANQQCLGLTAWPSGRQDAAHCQAVVGQRAGHSNPIQQRDDNSYLESALRTKEFTHAHIVQNVIVYVWEHCGQYWKRVKILVLSALSRYKFSSLCVQFQESPQRLQFYKRFGFRSSLQKIVKAGLSQKAEKK